VSTPSTRIRPAGRRWRLALALLGLAGCSYYEQPRFQSAQVLGGAAVPAATLNRGADAFMRACRPCHGALGDGKGPQAVGMDPPPRDLRLGVVAYASVPAGSLWRDEDVVRIVRSGLGGTGMRAWKDLPDEDLAAIVQFLKTLAPRFREERPGEPVTPSVDPWAGREADGAARGRAVYHGLGRCQTCHPAYASPTEIQAFARAADLYRSIAAGLGGTAMPTWKGALPEADLWALVHYVDALSRGVAVPAVR